MSRLLDFVKTTLAGGFFVVLPMMIIYLLLGEVLDLAQALAQPVIDVLPEGFLQSVRFPTLLSILLVVLVSLVFGLLLRTEWGRIAVAKFEQGVLEKIPGYTVIRSFARGFKGDKADDGFQPALLTLPLDGRALVFIVERTGEDQVTVFVPSSPTPGVGTVQLVPADRVKPLDVGFGPAFDALSQWGKGLQDIVPRP